MAARRRKVCTYSLRTLLFALTIGCIWLGRKVQCVRERQDAVKVIETLGGAVVYSWQPQLSTKSKGHWTTIEVTAKQWSWRFKFDASNNGRPGPAWLRDRIGDDFFQNVVGVAFVGAASVRSQFSDDRVRAWIPALKRLPTLQTLIIEGEVSEEMMHEVKAALPHCKVSQCEYYTFPKGL